MFGIVGLRVVVIRYWRFYIGDGEGRGRRGGGGV
jgi:hypothetical protein